MNVLFSRAPLVECVHLVIHRALMSFTIPRIPPYKGVGAGWGGRGGGSGQLFHSKLMKMGSSSRIDGGIWGVGEGVYQIVLSFFFLDSSWCSIEKNWCVYLSFVSKHVLQDNCSNKIWNDCHCNSFNSVDSYSSCINYSCK